MRSFIVCTPHEIFSGNKIMNNEMGEAYGTYRGEKRCKCFGGRT
jgi:hypothetical protein